MGKDIKGKELGRGITQCSNGVYRARFFHNGESYTISNPNLKQLKQDLDDMRYEVRNGLKENLDNVSLDTWFEKWLEVRKSDDIKESTKMRYEDFYRRYIGNELGKMQVKNLTTIRIDMFLHNLRKRELSEKTVQDAYLILKAMLNYAIDNDMLKTNPCKAKKFQIKYRDARVLSEKEQREVIKHAKGRIHGNMIEVALGTGLRSGELRGLTWDDIDFEKREISINKTLVYIKSADTQKYVFKYQTPKTKNSIRTIPMLDSVYEALKRQRIQVKRLQMMNSEWQPLDEFPNLVFVGKNGRPISERAFQSTLDWIKRAIDKEREEIAEKNQIAFEPIPHFYPHAFRHTFATRCFEIGMDVKVMQKLLGHSSISITMDMYVHVTEDKTKEEMAKLKVLYEKAS